ncbi:MAG: glycosyltransferase family 4 protein, partial [Gammaproteobacteria bacterium]
EIVEADCASPGSAATAAAVGLVKKHGITGAYFTDMPLASRRYLAMRGAGVDRIVLHEHRPGARPPVRGVKGLAKSIAYAAPWWTCDRYVCTTEFIRQRMIDNARLAPDRCVVVPNGIDPLDCDAETRREVRAELGAMEEDVMVALVSRAHEYKNIEFANDVAAAVFAQDPGSPLRFIVIGDGPHLERFRQRAASLGLGDRFRFLGRRSDVRRLLCGFDLGFQPSKGEVGYSLSILEMMSAGLPVVVSDNRSVAGATRDGETGFLYGEGDTGSAVCLLRRLAADREERRTVGSAARRDSRERFSFDGTLQSLRAHVCAFLEA